MDGGFTSCRLPCEFKLKHHLQLTGTRRSYFFFFLLQLPKLGLKFSLSIGMATVGVAYIAMGYVNLLSKLMYAAHF